MYACHSVINVILVKNDIEMTFFIALKIFFLYVIPNIWLSVFIVFINDEISRVR